MLNLYYRISDPSDVRDLGNQMAAWLAAGNPKADAWAEQPAAPSADAVWQDGAWSVPPVPTTTAEDHLKAVGIGGERQPTLLYLRQSLAAAGKQCEELDALEGYLQMILAMYAADQSPRSDWPVPNVSFEQAVSAAMSALSSNP
jgi:hypothetical protein